MANEGLKNAADADDNDDDDHQKIIGIFLSC